MTIVLPLPADPLQPNKARSFHWSKVARARKKARADAKLAAIAAINEDAWRSSPGWISATVKCRFYFRANRRHDPDNLIGSLKPSADGFTDAGVWRDDSGVVWLPPEVFVDSKNPRVEITVEEGAKP